MGSLVLPVNVSSTTMKMLSTSTKQSPPGPPAKTFFCVFCRDIVSLAVGNLVQFKTHMETVHQVFYEFDILLALNFIDRKEKEKIIDTVKGKVNGKNDFIKVDVKAKENAKAEENLLKEKTDWGNLDNVQVVILDENTSIKDALKNVSMPKSKVRDQPVKTMVSSVIKSEIKQEPTLLNTEIKNLKTYQCGKCDKIFPSRFNLKNHMNKKFSCLKPLLECEKCSKIFKEKKAHELHMARTKSCVRPRCEKCAKKFTGWQAYKVHIARKNSCVKPNYSCEKCSKCFNKKTNYEVHMSRRKSCVKTKYSCEKCSKTFDKKTSYDVHLARTKSCVKPNLKCGDCLKVFSTSFSLNNHISNKETACKKRVSCEKCGKIVKESKYELHLNKRRGCVQVSLKCDGCLKTFSTRAVARSHQLRKETVCKKRIECERCGERYREELYKKHILKKRSCVVEEPKCGDCGKTFSTQTSAGKHMLDQKGQCNMKFGCENCGNSFNGIHSLKMHQRTSKHCLKLQSESVKIELVE